MKVSLIAIGNSRGVRLPASVIQQCGFGDELDLRVENGTVVLAPLTGGRAGWDAAFKAMADAEDDEPVWPEAAETTVEAEDWAW